MKTLKLALLLVTMTLPVMAIAGPFGLEKGMTLAEIGGNPQKVANGMYKITTVPKPHSAFESYIVQVGPTTGLCLIRGIGKNISTSIYGTEIKSALTEMKEKLSVNYGKPGKDVDILLSGSIWNEPNDWMMALLKKERFFGAIWGQGDGSTLPQDIKAIALSVSGINRDTAFLVLEYSFSNKDACGAEIDKTEDSAL